MPSDIRIEHLIFKYAPPAAHPYIKLARLDRPAGTWLLLLPCLWSVALAHQGVFGMGARGWGHALLFAVGALLMRSAGCVVNDLWDQRLDAAVDRTKDRPLPKGEVTQRQALAFLAALLVPAFLILLCFNLFTVVLGLLSVPLVAAYPLMKRVTWWPQAFLGLTFSWGALMGFAAAEGELGAAAFLLYVGGILWTLAYDTIYAHQDREDDALAGIRSTARLFGERSGKYVAWFYAGALLCILAAKYTAFPSVMTPLLLAAPAWMAWHILSRWDMNDAQSCLDAFRRNVMFGGLVLLMLAV